MDVIQELRNKISAENLWSRDFKIKRNEYLLREGEIEKYIYFIEEGSIRAYVSNEEEEYIIRFGYKNSIITALDSFFSGKPSRLNLQAIKQCRIRAVRKEDFNALIQKSPENTRLYQFVLEQLIVQQMEREMDILTVLPVDRYKRVQERSPHLFQEIPNKHIASYLRMTPETLSRLKKS